ncbi:MAG: glycosyltransferase family 2 protein [Lyngbya sp.]|nr:glycosyltransferase family 2 protein [Lyngbya sp.]
MMNNWLLENQNIINFPSLNDLPEPPSGKKGWPWTVEEHQLFESQADISNWPKISIVTTNYNYGRFIEETIRSVLLQGYPNLEYIIMDGGSTDESVDIIKKYEPWLTYWVSEPDFGQPHGINKGFKRATGDIVAFLNSDDLYQPNALRTVGKIFAQQTETKWIGSSCQVINDEGKNQYIAPVSQNRSKVSWVGGIWFPQPSVFWRRSIMDEVGLLDESLNYCFDQEYWARLVCAGYQPVILNQPLGTHRDHPVSKTGGNNNFKIVLEHLQVAHRYMTSLTQKECQEVRRIIRRQERYLIRMPIHQLADKNPGLARRELFSAIFHHRDLLLDRATWGCLKSLL